MGSKVREVTCCFSGPLLGLHIFPATPMSSARPRSSPSTPHIVTKTATKNEVLGPSEPLPNTETLPVALARELESSSGDCADVCGTFAFAGPIVSVLVGVNDSSGMRSREGLMAALRREIHNLLRCTAGVSLVQKANKGVLRPQTESMEIMLRWCSSSIIPTYNTGLDLGMCNASVQSLGNLAKLAWAFRFFCATARLDMEVYVPMLSATCSALCGPCEDLLWLIKGAIYRGTLRERSVTISDIDGENSDMSTCSPSSEDVSETNPWQED